MKVLVTGSGGLIGSELVTFFDGRAQSVIGVDNNMRAHFFGHEGDTTWNLRRLSQQPSLEAVFSARVLDESPDEIARRVIEIVSSPVGG